METALNEGLTEYFAGEFRWKHIAIQQGQGGIDQGLVDKYGRMADQVVWERPESWKSAANR